MKKLLYKNKLTDNQQENWDCAVLKYRKIREKNIIQSFQELSETERQQLMKDILQKKEFDGVLSMNIVDEKSALFLRLLEGKSALIYPPPCAYSYPWYDVIEEKGPWNLSIETEDINGLLISSVDNEQQVLIEQTPWKILNKKSEKEMIVTFGKWEQLGFCWMLKKIKKPCTDTKSFIYCHHKDNISRITTMEDLRNEQYYYIKKDADKIKLVLDIQYREDYKKSLIEKYGNHMIIESILLSEIQLGEELLTERRLSKLTDYPTNDEIKMLVNKKIKEYLDNGYSIDNEGNLFVEVWLLEKIAGEIQQNMYMKID